MNSIITNFQVGATSDINLGVSDKLNEMNREAGFVKEETRFFIRMLKQSKFYSGENKKKEIEHLAKKLDAFMQEDQRNIENMIRGELLMPQGEEVSGVGIINQRWHAFSQKFRKLKTKAMSLLGDFFVVRFQ